MFKIMRSLRSSKCLKTTVELTFTTQKANACSPWTACSVFNWKYLFWVNLAQKLKIISLSWNSVPRLIQICRIPWWCSFFFVFDWKHLSWQNWFKKSKLSVWAEISRKTNFNKQNSMMIFTFWVFDWKYLLGQIWSKKSKLLVWAEILR